MTLSGSSSPRRTLLSRLAAIEDGTLLKFAFFGVLLGTASVLVIDYLELNAQDTLFDTMQTNNPVLPAVDRPEIDPASPAFRPQERITAPREVLAAPLDIALEAEGVLRLTGTIGPGASGAFAEEVARRGSYVRTVVLNSPGGSVDDALAIAQLVYENGFATAVENGALCASSCPLILAAGAKRAVAPGASVGVHQIYASGRDAATTSPAQAMSDAQAITARIARRLGTYEVDPALWVHAMETPPDRLYYLTRDELDAYGLNRP